jgi:cytochrome bd ubiquinol oxidase subunit II
MGVDLPLLWVLIIGFALMMYVIMDGFDLGIGILFPFVPETDHRDVMVNTVAPVWDGNETWLALGGASLFAAFPIAYGVLLTAFYIPIVFMLLGLIWRGVSFEFRFKADESHRPFWDKAFTAGSYLAAFCQGAALGAFIKGVPVTGGSFQGGALDWLSPFSVFTGLGVIVGYALLGSSWLIIKTEGALHRRMIVCARWVTIALFVVILIVSIWTPLTDGAIASRWFSLPEFFYFVPVPILVLAVTWLILRLLNGEPHTAPFLLSLVLVFLGYSGLAISLWPHIVPPSLSFRDASSPPQSQGFALVGALFIIPIILTYSAWSYHVFRGKVKVGEGYH